MKFIGSKRDSKQVKTTNTSKIRSLKKKANPRKSKMSRKKKILITVCSVLGLLIVLGASAFAVVRWQVEPFYSLFFRPTTSVLAQPRARTAPVYREVITYDEDGNEVIVMELVEEEVENTRNEDIFTFLILGDDLHGNTDAIMVMAFDTTDHTIEVVNIPRDTIVNVSWNLRKVNSIRANMFQRYRNESNTEEVAMQATLEQFGNLLGFVPDFWITVNMRTLPRLIDAIGGVEYNVPRRISYEQFTVSGGLQTLNGRQALHILRYRGFASGDIGRMNTHQTFLEAAAAQILANRESIEITTLAEIFLTHVRTNIQLNHLVWFGREFLQMDSDNINFSTMPGVFESIRGNFYISVLLDEWLEMINTRLNPNELDVTRETVSILTRNENGELFVTDGNWAGSDTWGANSRAPQRTTSQTERYTGSTDQAQDPDNTPEDIPVDD